jgi:hypothetical protein
VPTVGQVVAVVDAQLGSGLLECLGPGCGGRLARWGFGVERDLVGLGGTASQARSTSRISITDTSRNTIPATSSRSTGEDQTGMTPHKRHTTPLVQLLATGWSHAHGGKPLNLVPCRWRMTVNVTDGEYPVHPNIARSTSSCRFGAVDKSVRRTASWMRIICC